MLRSTEKILVARCAFFLSAKRATSEADPGYSDKEIFDEVFRKFSPTDLQLQMPSVCTDSNDLQDTRNI